MTPERVTARMVQSPPDSRSYLTLCERSAFMPISMNMALAVSQ